MGHGKREDQRSPKLLVGGLGYGIRIVQVAAGGGLVRVAHSLLLTSNGKVLSFGTGQYGALGALSMGDECITWLLIDHTNTIFF